MPKLSKSTKCEAPVIWVLTIACVAVAPIWIASYGTRAASDTPTVTQDPASLDRRINMIEHRVNFIETSIRRLEQQIVASARPVPSTEPARLETDLLRRDVETLKGHLSAIECGMAKLDERTLSPSVRESSGQDQNYKDPCRQNPETQLQLFTRQ